jgi:hypothetical protein
MLGFALVAATFGVGIAIIGTGRPIQIALIYLVNTKRSLIRRCRRNGQSVGSRRIDS